MVRNFKKNLNKTIIQNLVLLVLLVLLIFIFNSQNPLFLSPRNLYNIPRQILPTVIMACAMTFVINSGAIDLSVGGVMTLSAIVYGKLVTSDFNAWFALFLCLVLGIIVGAFSSFLVNIFNIPSIMATMAVWIICNGVAYALIKAIPIFDSRLSPIFQFNSIAFFDGKVPLAFFIIAGVVFFFLFLEKKTKIGKYSIAIGGNENAARNSGINISKFRLILFMLSGLMASFSGLWQVARIGASSPLIGNGMEFQVIGGCILGGVNIKGGNGSITGMLLGTLILAILMNGLNMIGFDPYYQQVATGIVILLAVIINYFIGVQSRKMLQRQRSILPSK